MPPNDILIRIDRTKQALKNDADSRTACLNAKYIFYQDRIHKQNKYHCSGYVLLYNITCTRKIYCYQHNIIVMRKCIPFPESTGGAYGIWINRITESTENRANDSSYTRSVTFTSGIMQPP